MMTVDPITGFLYIYGGTTITSSTRIWNDLWIVDPRSDLIMWANGNNTGSVRPSVSIGQVISFGPGRAHASFTLLNQTREILLFGGWTPSYNQLWSYSILENSWKMLWGDLSDSVESYVHVYGSFSYLNRIGARFGHTAAFDTSRNQLLIFGGARYTSHCN